MVQANVDWGSYNKLNRNGKQEKKEFIISYKRDWYALFKKNYLLNNKNIMNSAKMLIEKMICIFINE